MVFEFVNVDKQYTPVYNASGNWAGQRFTGYQLRQRFTVESPDVEKVETVSREISSLSPRACRSRHTPGLLLHETRRREDGADRESLGRCPYAGREDRRERGTKIGSVASARMGVFQITGANSNEEFSAGGSFNTANRNKKARITMRIEYRIR